MSTNNEAYRQDSFEALPVMDLLSEDQDGGDDQEHSNVFTEDAAVWCEKCGIHNIGDCIIHGGKMTVALDNAMPTRACLSLPKILALKRVRDSDPCSLEAKRGVFSKKFIKIRTLFGPMEAKRTHVKPKLQTGMVEYQLLTEGKASEYLDISDENSCNWMMFVRPANIFAQQNMAAFQDKGVIYFVTCKNIPKGTELRVWYAAAYAKAIGKRILLPEPELKKCTLSPAIKDKSLQEKLEFSSSPAVEKHKETVKNVSEQSNIKSNARENKLKAHSPVEKAATVSTNSPEKCTRSARVIKESCALNACNTCNTTFPKLCQLDSHICKELGEVEEESSGCGTRRRKGKPRKLLDSEDGPSSVKVPRPEPQRPETDMQIRNPNIPHEDIISHLKGENTLSDNDDELYSDTKSSITLLPSTALIPTTTEFSGDDGENQPTPKIKRGPGRPMGSKNKNQAFEAGKTPMKSETSPCKKQIYICKFCNKVFTNQEHHLVHESSHTNTLPYQCDYPDCGKFFNSKFKHQRHMAVHKKLNNFKCKFCTSTFNRVDHLKNHLLIHDSNRNTFSCDICGKSYLCRSNLTFHLAKHEAEEGSSLHCLVCETKFETKDQLKSHVAIHNRYKKVAEIQRKHSCPHCHKLFTTAKDIRRHMVTHSKDRHFLCEHCPQTFVRKDHLRRHYTSNHKKEFYESQLKDNPFGCNLCLLVFKRQEFLDYHMKSSHPEGGDVKNHKEKGGRSIVKPYILHNMTEGDPQENIVRVNRNSQNQLVKLLQKQPIEKLDTTPQQEVQFTSKPQQSLSVPQQQQQPEDYLVRLVKVQSVSDQNTTSRPYAIVHPASTQLAASQIPVYDAEDVAGETFATSMKTIPLRFQNQLITQLQIEGQSTSQLQQLQPDNQQDQQPHILQDQQTLLNRIQIQQQQQVQVQQQQFQPQQQIHQQVQSQPITSILQGMPIDILNSLGLGQTQDVPGQPSYVNIITVGGHNLIVRPGQVLDLNKPVQLTVLKDPIITSKHSSQPYPQPNIQQVGTKPEPNNLVYSQGQILRASISKPDHCYASATVTNPSFPGVIKTHSKPQLPQMDKSKNLQSSNLTEDQSTQILAQINNTDSGSTAGFVSNLPQNAQSQNEILATQQQNLQQQLQQQQDQFHQQENQQQKHQQLSMQNLPSFTLSWSDGIPDYSSVAEIQGSADVTSINQSDTLSTIVPGSAPGSWIFQLNSSMLDQQFQHLYGQHLPNSNVMTVSTPGPVSDN